MKFNPIILAKVTDQEYLMKSPPFWVGRHEVRLSSSV